MSRVRVGAETIYSTQHRRGAASPGSPPLVLLHGAGGTHLHWPPQVRFLPDLTVYALDLPGHGQSHGAGRDTVTAYRDVVLAWAEAMALPRFVVAGTSMGGAIAQAMALAAPARLAGIVLVGTDARLAVAPAILDGLRSDYAGTAQQIARWVHRREPDPLMVELYARHLMASDPAIVIGDFEACDRFDVTDQVGQIDLPALVIVGSEDRMTPARRGRWLAGQLPQATLFEVPDAGHSVATEAPVVVAGTIKAFVQGLV